MIWLYFDLETTAPPGGDARDAEQARPVQAALGYYDTATDRAEPLEGFPLLINPGCPVHPDSTKIHGLTDAHVEGATPLDVALNSIAGHITDAVNNGIPIVGMNLTYDFTVLDRGLRAAGLTTLAGRAQDRGIPADNVNGTHSPLMVVLDASVIERWADRFRKGSRKLVDLCARYGIELVDAHDADADAAASARLLSALVDVAAACADQHPHRPARYAKPTIVVPAKPWRPELELEISTPHHFAQLHMMGVDDLQANQAAWHDAWVDFITSGQRADHDVWPVRQLPAATLTTATD